MWEKNRSHENRYNHVHELAHTETKESSRRTIVITLVAFDTKAARFFILSRTMGTAYAHDARQIPQKILSTRGSKVSAPHREGSLHTHAVCLLRTHKSEYA